MRQFRVYFESGKTTGALSLAEASAIYFASTDDLYDASFALDELMADGTWKALAPISIAR